MAIRYPIVPNTITVHLGEPDEAASNVTVPFQEYISNVLSNEIYPTWPRNAVIANAYAVISFTMNRIYNEWYRSKGYNFDITSSPKFDQTYVHLDATYENIDDIVGEIFNNYIYREGQVQPLFTTYCDGRIKTCTGLSQWGTGEPNLFGCIGGEKRRFEHAAHDPSDCGILCRRGGDSHFHGLAVHSDPDRDVVPGCGFYAGLSGTHEEAP